MIWRTNLPQTAGYCLVAGRVKPLLFVILSTIERVGANYRTGRAEILAGGGLPVAG